jgi:IS1 family transposase
LKTAQLTQANGWETKKMVLEFKFGSMGRNTRENLETVLQTAEANFCITTVISTRVTGSTIRQKVVEFTFTPMGQNMTVSG